VGWDKDSLIAQQLKRENNNNRRIYKASDAQYNFLTTWKPDAQPFPKQRSPLPGQLYQLYAEHDIRWY